MITCQPEGGNSPKRFYILNDEECIALVTKEKTNIGGELCIVHPYDKNQMKMISKCIFDNHISDYFFWS